MILIVGSSNDDILYFESLIKNKKELTILNQFDAFTGKIFNQDVMLIKDVYSSYVSSAVISYVIQKYMAILVISVGSVQSFSDSLKVGDICICKQSICGDVNLTDVTNVSKGQILGFPQVLPSSVEITNSIIDAIGARTTVASKVCTYININYHPEGKEQLTTISEQNNIFGISGDIVLSSEIGGIATACKLHDIPYAAINVVGRQIGSQSNIDHYIHVLEQYTNVGKAVVSVIGEIGRTDVIGH